MPEPLPSNEVERLETLRRYNVLDTAAERCFDDLTMLAAQICETPVALLSLSDADRQWFKAHVGLPVAEITRNRAFCAYAIMQPDLFVVPDARADERFADNALVTGEPYIRFYAGASLVAPNGHVLGTICVTDSRPRELRPEQANALRALSRQIVSQLELRRSKELSRQSESRYRALMEQASDGIHTYDLQGNFIEVNSKLCEMLGYTRAELLRLNVADLVPAAELVKNPIRYAELRAGKTLLTERQLCCKDGTLLPVEISGRMIEDGLLQAIVRDCTHRKQVEEALCESEGRFRQLAENIHEVFWLSEPGVPDIMYVSPGYEEVWGRTCESLYAAPRSWLEAVHPADRERIRAAVELKQARGDYNEEYRIIRPDGVECWIRDRAFPIKNAAGEVYRLAGVAANITERKEVEASLRASEERFFKAFNASPVPMLMSNFADGRYLFVNDSFLQTTGFTRAEVVGRNTVELQLWVDAQDSERLTQCLAAHGRINKEAVRFRLKSGEVRTVLLSAEILEVLGERCIMTLIQDITERKLVERRLAAQHAVTRVLAEAATLAEATPILLRAVCEGLGWVLGALWYVDRTHDELHCVGVARKVHLAGTLRVDCNFTRKVLLPERRLDA